MRALQAERPEPVRHEPLSQNEIDAALLDPCVFIDQHCWIEGQGGKRERFRLWPEQRLIIAAMDDHRRLIILKARQLGISWCSDGYILWLCAANAGQTVIIVSKGEKEAQEELRRIKFMLKRLPPELRPRIGLEAESGERAKNNMGELDFPDNGSRIISLAPTEDVGSTFTASLVVVQELSKIAVAGPMMTSLNPLVADGGRLQVISTAKGYSGTYFSMWESARNRLRTDEVVGSPGAEGDYVPVFLPWRARPGRTDAWYESMTRQMSAKELHQEYPATAQEAFQGATDAVFGEEFDRHLHGLDAQRDRSNVFPVFCGADPGVQHAAAHLLESQGRTVFVFAEIHLENGSVEELGQAIFATCVEQGLDPAGVLVFMDPFDVGRNAQTLKTDLDVLAEQGLLVDREDERYSPAQRVGLFKVLLKNQRLWVSQDCPLLLDALERAQWKMRRAPGGMMVAEDTYAKDGFHEHFLDASGTAIARIFPPIAPAAAETTHGNIMATQFSFSGSEYG